MLSGMMRSLAKSPPPITLPARAVEIGMVGLPSLSVKKERLYEWVTSSEQDFELEYGS